MLRYIAILLNLLLASISLLAQLQSPNQFLRHRVGEMYTPHHRVVDYFEHVAANSAHVKLVNYGYTEEDRPLLLAVISSPENLAKIDAIRENNLRRAGLLAGKPDPALDRAIVWMSYTVHGNEAPGTESSMLVLHDLANPSNQEMQEWLRNTVVLIDPCSNPDGFDRYTHWFRGVANRWPSVATRTIEHIEPWPRGRVNHYMFDLNRDWAWQTQVESRHRIAQYRQWLPHVHADFHEQGYESPYYFAPAAQPYHAYLTDWQSDFQQVIGKNHARYFDQNGWLYFTREVFDLLYPSYGDTYPMFTGAIGMTYEQAGNSSGGRGIQLSNGDTLTLADRVIHHYTTGISTVEISSKNAGELVKNFESFYDRSQKNPVGPYKTYVIKGTNPEGRLKALASLLDLNGIRYGRSSSRSNLRAYDYHTGQEVSVWVEPGDMIVSAFQPNSVLAQVLMDPKTELVDSMTYDITAWSLPYAYGLQAYASTATVKAEEPYTFAAFRNQVTENNEPYAYIAPWQSMQDAKFLSEVLRSGLVARRSNAAFTVTGKRFAAGSVVISRADNRKRSDFNELMRSLINKHQTAVQAVSSGMSSEGADLGSESFRLIPIPKIAVLGDEPTYSYEFGAVWFYFERQLEYPVDVYPARQLSQLPLDDYNVLVMPEGYYSLSNDERTKLSTWVRKGGRLIAVGDALHAFAGESGFGLAAVEESEEKEAAATAATQSREPYAGQERRAISSINAGAIFKVDLDETHPLASGLGSSYFSLKTNTLAFKPLEEGWSVGMVNSNPKIVGFVGYKAIETLKNTLVFGVEEKGRGSIVYLVDNPLFRGFWENGKLLFSNAVFFH